MIKLVMEFLPHDSDPLKELILDLASEKQNAERLWEAKEKEYAGMLEEVEDLGNVLLKRMLRKGVELRGGGGSLGEGHPRTISERKAMLNWT